MSIDTGHSAAGTEPEPDGPRRPRRLWKLTLSGLIGLFALLACYDVASGLARSTGASATGTASPSSTRAATSPPAAPTSPAPLRSSASSAAVPHVLDVASVAAFGPDGTSDGDNPGVVSRINEAGAQPWYSSWYASPEFGNLQSGTGLLLDMGGAVKLSGLRLVLGPPLGADVQVRAGNRATLDRLATVASATDVGGTVRLPVTSKVSGRYVLVWFTKLPPNGQPSQYQIAVYSVTVTGTASSGA